MPSTRLGKHTREGKTRWVALMECHSDTIAVRSVLICPVPDSESIDRKCNIFPIRPVYMNSVNLTFFPLIAGDEQGDNQPGAEMSMNCPLSTSATPKTQVHSVNG